MEQETKVYIIIGAVAGSLVVCALTLAVLFVWTRSRRRMRGFSLRAVTPLDDAEFESWRRPSQYNQRLDEYGIRPSNRVVLRDRVSPRTPSFFEKELSTYDFPPRTPSLTDAVSIKSPTSSIQKPEQARRKSSVASSLADRPPTPYSPCSPSGEFNRGSVSSRRSQPLIHYPSVSETSAFRFNFEAEQKRNGNWI
ncbi:hypothetical protein COCC4DRAFT_20683 [Bipolaris maydis ATCC 48331]|uniref:Uncharacterized protein n=3 Tax=Cochliobolus heterostrophus TaxID=5016 RepID=M2TYK6_COCH5|nr:uncharacterized protein COCC4DRAFT_20683 [Bipolaris maydis ATCC 48331]EMD91364.1 hypothetical protein COCHEDRAFT_1102337 [Bipolaris maydis C5]ENI08877.1 hypothetical protein COCC4DRAFT_20683 [Bipolaris maydis ATCC 48331]KAH7559227.1 hypothetical protein BM1_04164 [Bipolaris maydis]KAJ6208765.1 hypothetical protein PSV09DRAFT_1102337 [Bipolaris maydis]